MLKTDNLLDQISEDFDRQALPSLKEFVRIDNLSPAFDPGAHRKEKTFSAVSHVKEWIGRHTPDGTSIQVLTKVEESPLLLVDVPGTGAGTVMIYGHLDKQPPMTGWRNGLHPYKPVIEGTKMYGRGAVDDGYAPYSSILAINQLRRHDLDHPRCILVLETSEESNSIHLEPYFPDIMKLIGTPDLVICLDSACGDYDRLWYTNALRGAVIGVLTVRALETPVHSGSGGCVVPSALGIAFELLSRVCKPAAGVMTLPSFQAQIPQEAEQSARAAAAILGDGFKEELGLLDKVAAVAHDGEQAIINGVWKGSMSVTGIDGVPSIEEAGNVVLPEVRLKLSTRVPPGCDSRTCADEMSRVLTSDVPYGASANFEIKAQSDGWKMRPLPDWLRNSLDSSSSEFFGAPAVGYGIGGSIPFVNPLDELFEDTPILVTGLIGPEANAHGPNESLDLPAARKITACLARVLNDLAEVRANG